MMSYTYSVVISKASSLDASTHAKMVKKVMLCGDYIPVLLLTQEVLTFKELDTVFRYSV